MIKDMENKKAKLKEKILKAIDEHFEEFSKRSDDPEFTMAEIEHLMLEQQKQIRETLTESNSELVTGMEAEVKKNARSAAIQCGARKKLRKQR